MSESGRSGLRLEGIGVRYGSSVILDAVDLEVASREFVVVVGPSGCGKSTLLRVIAGLARPDRGRVWIDGTDVTSLEAGERDVAMVFQNYALYPHMTVRANLEFPLRMRRVSPGERALRVAATAGSLGIADLLDRRPDQLSGGQMQRVALGRALIRDPKLFLFDEPLSNLDAKLRVELRSEILRLHERFGQTTVYVTHDQAEAMTLGERVVVLRSGVIEQIGAPLEVFNRPANTFVAAFVGSPAINLLAATLEDRSLAVLGQHVPRPPLPAGTANGPVTVGLRPHRVSFTGPIEATVRQVDNLGGQAVVEFEAAGSLLRASHAGDSVLRRGDRATLGFDLADIVVFDAAGNALRPD